MHLKYLIASILIRCFYFSIITGDDENEEVYNTEDCEFAAKKRKKDHFRNNTDSQCKAGVFNLFWKTRVGSEKCCNSHVILTYRVAFKIMPISVLATNSGVKSDMS